MCGCLWWCLAGEKDVRVAKERSSASYGALGRSWKVLSSGVSGGLVDTVELRTE